MSKRSQLFAGIAVFLVLGLVMILNPMLRNFSQAPPLLDLFHPPRAVPGLQTPPIAVMRMNERMPVDADEFDHPIYYRLNENRTGVDDENVVPLKLKTAWRFENLNVGLHTASKASPVVDATGVYVGGDTGWFYAFDLDGKVRWKFHAGESARGIHSTAVLTKSRVCFGAYNGSFYCLNKQTGDLIWMADVPGGGVGGSPLVVRGQLYLAYELGTTLASFLTSLDMKDGKMNWRSVWFREQTHSSPTYVMDTNSVYFGDNAGYFHRVSAKDGQRVWSTYVDGPMKSTALYYDDKIYITTWGKNILCVDPRGGGVLWKTSLDLRSQSSPTPVPKTSVLIMGSASGFIYGVDRNFGNVLWKVETGLSQTSSALVVRSGPKADSYVAWVPCSRNELCALSPKDGKILSRISLPGSLSGVPFAFKGELYVALNFPGGLVKLTAETSKIKN